MMPRGKPLVKNWEHPRNIRKLKPSRYEQNEASVKAHWINLVRALELSYKDEKFWESNCDLVRDLVGKKIFRRIAKIFNLPAEETVYEPKSDLWIVEPSEEFYDVKKAVEVHAAYSVSDFDPAIYEEDSVEEEYHEEQSEWSTSSPTTSIRKMSRSRSLAKSKSLTVSKSKISSKILSKQFSKQLSKSQKSFTRYSKAIKSEFSFSDEPPSTLDDLEVHCSTSGKQVSRRMSRRFMNNPHFDMLYCNKSETDMIKWKSKYKQNTFEVSASDEFSKKAEIMTKKIAKEFFDWWVGLGNVEFKSEIKRPEDIEDLFQVWFDEHASRGLVLDNKILPCVLQSIADYVVVKKASCPKVLKRQIAYDVRAETSPAHVSAFGTCLPQSMKHIPPMNNTKQLWGPIQIPEDLRSMACVWDEVLHLTSTKAFNQWLKKRPHMPMPPIFQSLEKGGDKKQPFVIPSDFVFKSTINSTQDLALPVSQFSLELKEVLSKLLNE